jgi:DNA-binding transcriptional LysR family regulator
MALHVPNLRHLQVFSEVVKSGSMTAAARASHLSQPAVTQAIGALERIFATKLLARASNGVVPTASGSACSNRIDRALMQIDDALAEARGSRPRTATPASRSVTTARLQALIAVVEHRGFGSAARALGVSRPTLHRAARDLERIVETALFERTSFGVEPTREAEQLARRISLAFAELEQARADISALAGGDQGRTVIGAMPLARSFLVPNAVLAFAVDHPEHRVAILDGPYESMLDALRKGGADVLIGAMRAPAPYDDIVQEPLFDDPLAIIMRAGHPLAGRKRASARDLARFPWVAPRSGSPLRRQFDDLFRQLDIAAPAGAIECNSLVAARAILLSSDRIMLLSAHQIKHELQTGQLALLPHPLGRIVRAIGLTTRREWRPTAAQESLLARLRASAALLTGSGNSAAMSASRA